LANLKRSRTAPALAGTHLQKNPTALVMAPERRPETLRRWQVKDVELEHGDDRMQGVPNFSPQQIF